MVGILDAREGGKCLEIGFGIIMLTSRKGGDILIQHTATRGDRRNPNLLKKRRKRIKAELQGFSIPCGKKIVGAHKEQLSSWGGKKSVSYLLREGKGRIPRTNKKDHAVVKIGAEESRGDSNKRGTCTIGYKEKTEN